MSTLSSVVLPEEGGPSRRMKRPFREWGRRDHTTLTKHAHWASFRGEVGSGALTIKFPALSYPKKVTQSWA